MPRPALLLALLLLAVPLRAWGDKGHRVVSALALKGLPPGPRAWFEGREALVEAHASDPDHWRQDRKEGPRHFMDLEPFGGPDRIPLTLEEARERGGGDWYRLGVVPWVIQDRWRDLVEAFRSGDRDRVALATSILGHYVADAHVPLHTTLDHDGRTEDQRGVHVRWESGLVERFVAVDGLEPLAAEADPAFPERPWAWLRTSHALVPQLLEDDQVADRTTPLRGRAKVRTEAYWLLFWARQGSVVKAQLRAAAKHLGDAVLSAWVQAGRPPAA
jgi:hypothetical protein